MNVNHIAADDVEAPKLVEQSDTERAMVLP